jgi:protein-disulfide isomerase-like protein with CxxC motif
VARLIYVMDPMCSWCWGFAPVLQGLAEQAAEHGVPLVLRVGGLRREQVAMDEAGRSRTLSYWQAVHAATGQSFDFDTGLPAGLIYDTEPACRALVAARGLDESRVWPLSLLIQQAFYQQGPRRPGSPASASPSAMTTRPPRPKRQRISAGSRILVSPGSRPCSPSTRASWPCSPMATSL